MKKIFYLFIALLFTSVGCNQPAKKYYTSGDKKYNLKDYRGAIIDYTKSIEYNPNNPEVYCDRGLAKRSLQDNVGAIADYTKAIELDPTYRPYLNRGNAKIDLQDYRGAIKDFNKAVELDPNRGIAYYNRGWQNTNLKISGEHLQTILRLLSLILMMQKLIITEG